MPCGRRRDPVARRAGLRPPPDPLSGLRENTPPARGQRRRDQYRSDCRVAGGTTTGYNTDLALCGTGAYACPPRGAPRRLNRAPTPLPDCFARCGQHISIFYYNNYFRYIKSRKACLRGAFVSYEGLTNSIRPSALPDPGTTSRGGGAGLAATPPLREQSGVLTNSIRAVL
jgi:hypothetical protein